MILLSRFNIMNYAVLNEDTLVTETSESGDATSKSELILFGFREDIKLSGRVSTRFSQYNINTQRIEIGYCQICALSCTHCMKNKNSILITCNFYFHYTKPFKPDQNCPIRLLTL